MRKQRKLFPILIIIFSSFQGIAQNPGSNEKPNIIVFLVDDMGLMDTSVPFISNENGNLEKHPLNDFYITPNLEKLAEQGIRFTNFYAHSVCSPSRVSILTGQNAARHGVTNWINGKKNNRGKYGPLEWNWDGIREGTVILPKLLKEQGYSAIHIGKAHFGRSGSFAEDPLNLGFDINVGGNDIGQPGSYYGKDGYGQLTQRTSHAVPHLEKYHYTDVFLTEALTLEAKDAITKAARDNKPFYLNMSHYAVHSPFQPDPRFIVNYENDNVTPRERAFASLIEGIDKSLGDILSHVRNLGLGENTLIFFLGDNGSDAPIEMIENYGSAEPLKGKKAMHWEGGMRIPFIASWVSPSTKSEIQRKIPIAQNGINTQMGTILDLFPTICEVTETDYPAEHTIDGFSLITQLKGETNKDRDLVFVNHYPHEHRSSYFTSMVKEEWKLIYHYPVDTIPQYELYHLRVDPYEEENLAYTAKEQLARMIAVMKDELKKYGALYPQVDGKVLNVEYEYYKETNKH